MNKEIKEILNFLTTLVKENKESDMPLKTCVMPFETLYKLLDYITNLEKENKFLKNVTCHKSHIGGCRSTPQYNPRLFAKQKVEGKEEK